ncbi:hypothetical protein IRJ41_001931 [Triplophysa rosa]|uniref:Uncharacterized protein n=1 Tax=Triplophysa rosa TaxID=992332 RepID=A0A9W8CAR7_TRIRA|nr:hypothetical protein IRJ41_001931 [Triplophysa rosa]
MTTGLEQILSRCLKPVRLVCARFCSSVFYSGNTRLKIVLSFQTGVFTLRQLIDHISQDLHATHDSSKLFSKVVHVLTSTIRKNKRL